MRGEGREEEEEEEEGDEELGDTNNEGEIRLMSQGREINNS